MRGVFVVVTLVAVFALASAPKGAKVAAATAKKPAAAEAPGTGGDRTITVTDATTLAEIKLAPPSQTTTLTFPIDVQPESVAITDPKKRVSVLAQGAVLVLLTREALPAGASVTATLTLVDGTQLTFALLGTTGAFDRYVRVEVALKERAAADSTQRLKTQLQETQARLDECVQGGADEGIKRLGASILQHDLEKSDVWTVEKRAFRSGIDKQNRLLVETQFLFRLFELTYLVFTIENRDPTKTWVLERAELAAVGNGSRVDVKVTSVEQALNAIPPGESSKVVVAFRMPQLSAGQTFTLKLTEKNGTRHFELADLRF